MNGRLRGQRRSERAAWLVLVATGLLVAGGSTGSPSSATTPPIEPAAEVSAAAGPQSPDLAPPATAPTRHAPPAAPISPAPLPPLPEPLVVTVVRGDTLWGIARRHHVPLATLIAANPQLHDPRLIHPGDQVWIPREALNVTSTGRPTTGTLVLTTSTTLTADHRGVIVIRGHGVTLDCGGHVVRGPGIDFYAHPGGIEIFGADSVTVRRCIVAGFVHNGLYAVGATNLRLEANTFVGNGNHGVHLDGVSAGRVTGNTSRLNGSVTAASGIVTTGSTGVAIGENVVSGNPWAGIALLDGTTSSTVESNAAGLNGTAFVIDASDGNALTANTAARNHDGFAILGSAGTVVSGNTASHNAHCGFCLDRGVSGATLSGNTADGNYDGFNIHASNANALNGNIASANRHYGFVVFGGASDNTLSHNTALRSGYYDAWEEGSGSGDVWSENTFRTTAGI